MKKISIVVIQCLLFMFLKIEQSHAEEDDLQRRIDQASPGDRILLELKNYVGQFKIPHSKSGESGNPIILLGVSDNKKNTMISSSGTGLTIEADHWIIDNISFKSNDIGIKISGSGNTLRNLAIRSAKQGIVIVKGEGNVVEGTAYPEGGSSLIVNVQSCCGKITSNAFGGAVEFDGSKYTISENSATWSFNLNGCNNTLRNNNLEHAKITKACLNDIDKSNLINQGHLEKGSGIIIMIVVFCVITFNY